MADQGTYTAVVIISKGVAISGVTLALEATEPPARDLAINNCAFNANRQRWPGPQRYYRIASVG